MLLKNLFNKSTYGTIGYISSQSDIDLLEQYILYNLPVLKEFKHIVVVTNYREWDLTLINTHINMWEKYFPTIRLIDNKVNRGHNFGTADLDNLLFDFCKKSNIEWLCKGANDIIFQESILDKEVNEADFYYLNGISYETLFLNNFDYNQILNNYFYPQTNFYFINVFKCDYLNDKQYLNNTFDQIKNMPNYNGKVWEYIKDWSCENFLKECINRNNLKKEYLLNELTHNKLCESIKLYKIGDPSHKNIMIKGICHFQYPDQPIIEI